MSDVAIRVENLSKAYRIGLKEQRHETLLGAMASFVRSPFDNYRNLRKLSHFSDVVEEQKSECRKQKSAASFPPPAFIPQPSPADVFWALRDVSFEVRHGEVLGIIGRNGAGKSTLLKILSRITEPTSGRALVHGRVASLLEVGTGMHIELTGRENIYLMGTVLGMRRKEVDRKFDAIVAFAEVEKFIDTPIKRYSSGMRVRLAFAVAAHLEPEILIIDEVLAVGDVSFQRKCLGKMGEVAQRGRTILFVSHNLGAVQTLCKKGAWIENGKLVRLDAVDEIISEYTSSFGRLSEAVLTSRVDRGGSGNATLCRTHLSGSDGLPLEKLISGRPCWVVLQYSATRSLRSPVFLCTIYNRLSQPLMHVRSTYRKESFKELPAQGTVRCRLDRLPLSPGSYRINVSIKDAEGVLAHVESAVTFSVEAGDYFNIGYVVDYVPETCLVDHQWTVASV